MSIYLRINNESYYYSATHKVATIPPWENDFVRSTVYTIASCAVAIFFFVAILVVAIYRVHMRRSLLLAVPSSPSNNDSYRTHHIHQTSDPLIYGDVNVFVHFCI